MQINDLFGAAAAFETVRMPDGTEAAIPTEHAAVIYVNEQPAFRVVCTPQLLPQLALGRLLTEGWIASAEEVEQIAVCAEGLKVNLYLNHPLTARRAAAQECWTRPWAACFWPVSPSANACSTPAAAYRWIWCAKPSGLAFRHW